MTKEEVLQKANIYCGEKGYTSETLTDDFKQKFSELFAKRYSEETPADADNVENDMKFSLDTVFSATSKWAKHKKEEFEEKENDYKRQIAELTGKPQEKQKPDISDELKEKLEKLERFEEEKRLADKFNNVLSLAKKSVRQDLHKSLENYSKDFKVTLDGDDDEQAKKLTERFQDIFKDSIGDIKPLAPRQTRKQDEEFLSSLPKIKVL